VRPREDCATACRDVVFDSSRSPRKGGPIAGESISPDNPVFRKQEDERR